MAAAGKRPHQQGSLQGRQPDGPPKTTPGPHARARGTAGPESDIDLLITAPDAWLERHHRFEVLNELWDDLAQADVSLDLLLYSQRECEERRHWRSHVIGRAYREGRLLDGAL